MTEKSKNIVVGFTTILGLAGLGFLVVLFGYVPAFLEGGYKLTVELQTASGLTPGSRVRLSGIDIGRVAKVTFAESPDRGPVVLVVTRIRQGVAIPQGVRVKAESPLLGGSPTLAFDLTHIKPDDKDYAQMMKPLATDGSVVIQGEALTLVSQFAAELQAAMAEPTRKFDRLTDSFDRLSTEWTAVGVNVNRLIEPRDPAKVDADNTTGNLTTVLDRADQRLRELQTTIDAINQWVSDKELKDTVHQILAQTSELTGKLNTSADQASALIDQVGQDADQLTKRYVAVADDMAGAIRSLHQTIELARQGDGTVGKLLTDPALYENLDDTAKRLKDVLNEMKLLIQKWKKEGLPVQF